MSTDNPFSPNYKSQLGDRFLKELERAPGRSARGTATVAKRMASGEPMEMIISGFKPAPVPKKDQRNSRSSKL